MQILLVSPKNVATPKRTKQAANYKAFYSFFQLSRIPPFFITPVNLAQELNKQRKLFITHYK